MRLIENLHFWITTRIKIISNPRKRKAALLALWFAISFGICLLTAILAATPIVILYLYGYPRAALAVRISMVVVGATVNLVCTYMIVRRYWRRWRKQRGRGINA